MTRTREALENLLAYHLMIGNNPDSEPVKLAQDALAAHEQPEPVQPDPIRQAASNCIEQWVYYLSNPNPYNAHSLGDSVKKLSSALAAPIQYTGRTITELEQMVADRLTLDAAGLPINSSADHREAYRLDDSEHATILAALRYYQEHGQGDPDNRSNEIHDIATNDGAVISLDADGIDDLCERLNCGEPTQH